MKNISQNYKELTLDNGMQIILQDTGTLGIDGRLKVNFGALHEKEGEEGLAHYLEHILITGGTQKYTPEQCDEILSNFPYYNASTGRYSTSFPVNMVSQDLELYLDLISNIIFEPRFDSKRINEEKQRILREMADRKGQPGFKEWESFNREVLGDDPRLYFVLGKESVINNVTSENLRNFHQRGYNANNMDLILVGGLPSNIEHIVKKYFEDKPMGKKTPINFPIVPPLDKRIIYHIQAPDLFNYDNPIESNADMRMDFIVPPEYSKESCTIRILTHLLGGDSISRLFRAVSSRNGLAYGIECNYGGSDNFGLMEISGRVQASRIDEAFSIIFEVINHFQQNLIDEKELNRFKKFLRYNLGRSYETNQGHINVLESKMCYGISPESHFKLIESITPSDIQRIANEYLPKNKDDEKYALMIRDPLKKD